ncbi:pyruvate, phosphate dikinase/phosphoenolpyruvate synthase regulator [Nostocoides sp. Soil756]|jgi:regulator of PEP synthase PpsR (kinase-PPPase family)|uniref:pyruvate, water dikinase regulatory protein n=1 Tax=Nostocoides sp. Soil756 TaxID=1736399 RepID=UPI0006F33E60|nr:pyruvate, phosphate dikinase/phosphoenolpyruvate synthase regulator [Tetrasphaera sp. Soil756]KRE63613.1 phosphoenolpyruvate synthetase regulatory protein [Tetrasphaera sp. Soil756]
MTPGDGPDTATPVFFLAGGTGISAETLGNLIISQFPTVAFVRRKIPFIRTVEQAHRVVEELDAAMTESVTPIVFSTVADHELREVLLGTRCAFIDLFGTHLDIVERVLHVNASPKVPALHGLGDIQRYERRMKAIDFSLEHDDGASLRNVQQAELILVAPSRCGKTPTSLYLALQHGVKVANYPLVDEDLRATELPEPVRPFLDRCVALTSTPARLSQVRSERRPGSPYASLPQCTWELKRAEELYRAHRLPVIDSSGMSVEEMAAVIMHTRQLTGSA